MANFGKPTKYERPEREEAPNPFIDVVKPFTDLGVDTAFPVTFDADNYNKEKLQIQKAVNAHGYSAREVERQGDPEKDKTITSTFVIRPKRKSKGEGSVDNGDGANVADEATGE